MDAVYLYDKYGQPIAYDTWQNITRLVEWVCAHWGERDETIWEFRADRREYLYSRLMCWVALDRAIRLAWKRSFPAPIGRWHDIRDTIYRDIMEDFPDVRSVASLFISRWDKATLDKVPERDRDKLGVAIGQQAYKAFRDLLESDRWQRLANCGARPQRLLFASTGTKDPKASDVLYISALAAPNTVNTMPEETLLAFGEHGRVNGVISRGGADCEEVLAEFRRVGIDVARLGADLQKEGAKSFDDSWHDLLSAIDAKSKALK